MQNIHPERLKNSEEIEEIREVPLAEFQGIRIGQTQKAEAGTGITVVISEDPRGMAAGLHIGGGGPATRETGILDPVTTAQRIHAAVLGGGSAYGLDAAGGVFDLPVGDPHVRPDREMGYEACKMSETNEGAGNYKDGCYGAGCGATIGKYAGPQHGMKSGIGSCVLQQGDLLVGAIIAVNAFGDIYDWKTGSKIAGAHDESGRLYSHAEMIGYLRRMEQERMRAAAFNTTIGIVFTNAPFEKPQLCKIAAMAHDGFARSIAPVHTSGDGDSIIALSVSGKKAPVRDGQRHNETAEKEGRGQTVTETISPVAGIDTVGSLAAWAVSEAILRGVRSAESAYGFTALRDLQISDFT